MKRKEYTGVEIKSKKKKEEEAEKRERESVFARANVPRGHHQGNWMRHFSFFQTRQNIRCVAREKRGNLLPLLRTSKCESPPFSPFFSSILVGSVIYRRLIIRESPENRDTHASGVDREKKGGADARGSMSDSLQYPIVPCDLY